MHLHIHITPEIYFDIGDPDLLEFVSFWEENVFFLEFHTVHFLYLQEDFMLSETSEYLFLASRKLKSDGLSMELFSDFMTGFDQMALVVLGFFLFLGLSFDELGSGDSSQFLRDEEIPCVCMAYFDDLSFLPDISDSLQELYGYGIVCHRTIIYEMIRNPISALP